MSTDKEKQSSTLALGKKVILQEASALTVLSSFLDDRFPAAVQTMLQCRGRVAVTGMGKSGHIAKKIAATLSSTGTPAFFIHPAEASHGDLGAVTAGDVILALSNSGNSLELTDIINYAGRHSIPLIAITRNKASLLGSHADICLLLPDEAEACPIGCAPTSSTTMQLALGDALAMALIDMRGFSAEDFRDFHPGGALGNRLMRVRDIMHSGDALPVVPPHTPMSESLVVMTSKGFGCLAVAEDNHLLGVISDGDLRRHMSPDLLQKTAGEIMTANPVVTQPDTLASKALGIMNHRAITSLFVVSNNTLAGLVHVHDCLRAGIK